MLLRRIPRAWCPQLCAILLALATFVTGASVTGPERVNVAVSAALVVVNQGSVALLWMAMALGFGGAMATFLGLRQRRPLERLVVEAALGIACGLAVDTALGTFGWLTAFRGIVPWVMIACGVVLLLLRIRAEWTGVPRVRAAAPAAALGLAIGVLLLAASSDPGWIWRSEFGGYDALSYHLQLPREWLVLGRIATLDHNVYSALPSFVEAAFMHLFLMTGSVDDGALAAQMLSACFTLTSAAAVWSCGHRVGGRVGAALAAALYLGTPWIIVVGSLAYNDGVVPLFLATGLLVCAKPPARTWQLGATLGVFFAGACGSKLTAAGFVVAPICVVLLLRMRVRALAALAIAGALSATLLAPWLVRNALATGNPVFPFASTVFGTGHWSAEQAAIFLRGHSADPSEGTRIERLWNQWLAARQWSLLVVPACASIVVLVAMRRRRSIGIALAAVVAVQVVFWLVATHVQSRFLVPTAVPLAIAIAALMRRMPRARRSTVATIVALCACAVPVVLHRDEGPAIDGAPTASMMIGGRMLMTGEATQRAMVAAPDDATRATLVQQAVPPYFVNFLIPPNANVLLLGDATPFWYRRPPSTLTYATVWDRGPLSAIAAEMPDQPERWAAALRAQGYEFVLVNELMLRNWTAKGWLDPNLTLDRLGAFIKTTYAVRAFPNRVTLVRLSPAP